MSAMLAKPRITKTLMPSPAPVHGERERAGATLPKHFYRIQGYIDPEAYHVLFDDRYPAWGMQTRIIKALVGALARHVERYCDPHLPSHERDNELQLILERVTFMVPRRPRGGGHGRAPATGALGSDPFPASSGPQEPSEPRLGVREPSGAPDAPEGPQSAKEATATATA
jgi:hypothetical protein